MTAILSLFYRRRIQDDIAGATPYLDYVRKNGIDRKLKHKI